MRGIAILIMCVSLMGLCFVGSIAHAAASYDAVHETVSCDVPYAIDEACVLAHHDAYHDAYHDSTAYDNGEAIKSDELACRPFRRLGRGLRWLFHC